MYYKLKDNVDFKELKKFGFKYGTRDRFLYRTISNGRESMIYIDLLPCHNNNNELKIECESRQIPVKIIDKLYDLIKSDLIEKSVGKSR